MPTKTHHKIKITINGEDFELDDGEYTGAQLKAKGNVPPEEGLFLKHGNGREQRIDDDEVVKIHPNMVFESAPDGGVS